MKRVTTWFGVLLMFMGVAMVISVPLFFWQSKVGARALLRAAPAPIHIVLSQAQGVLYPAPAKAMAAQTAGTPVGSLWIAAIGLRAPIVEGTSDWQLRDAVGHLIGTPFPGEMGVSILAGHNVTFFHEIGRLRSGDFIQVDTKQGEFTFQVMEHRLLHVGETLSTTHFPALALETCYPFNDWNLTPYRYIVEAALIKSALSRAS
ncbi:hypothetical protein BM613_11065 [Sulfoacidibacillus thermotolerans]|uniref:Sortase n=2 Tax=Sulfoacidibacillus thermotolerans TaxID=1765684 RepID=A0A2U3D6M7_SULT2|nr:hypothetical protein BM613_11065 [Sulfoacidibacillus thermotolerans]